MLDPCSKIIRNSNGFPVLLLLSTLLLVKCSQTLAVKPVNQIELQGHRGARGLVPENSLVAMQTALKYPVTTLELDVHLTSDNIWVLFHDHYVNPQLCDIPQDLAALEKTPVNEWKSADLLRVACGHKGHPKFESQQPVKVSPVKLEDIIDFWWKIRQTDPKHKNLELNVEIKIDVDNHSKSEAERNIRAMVDFWKKRPEMAKYITIQSFVPDILPQIRKNLPDTRISALFEPNYLHGLMIVVGVGSSIQDDILAKTLKYKAQVVSPYWRYVDTDWTNKIHRAGKQVIVWTVNDCEAMVSMFEAGVDGVISDYPDILTACHADWQKRQQSKK